ncbi:MAG TPA: hypothetical protein DCS43_08910 [Verrucomicrobia bacterium]|nr:hypothetical protein [Verrucomicrobiota bacterium]
MMTISETIKNGITIMEAAGRLDSDSAPETGKRLAELIDGGIRQFVLDLSALDYVSSAGLRVLLNAARGAQKAGGRLVLAAASPQVKQVLDMVGFGAIIPVFDTTAAGCASFAPPPAVERPAPAPLSFAEELYLLALDDAEGVTKPMPPFALDYAMAGALLMELALDGRIDTDLRVLKVTSSEPTKDPLLNDVLRDVQAQPKPQPVAFWLKHFADESKRIEERVLAGLVAKGVLKQENRRVLWVFAVRRYPIIDDREVKEVRTRLRELITSDEIPEPRDVVLLSLAKACRLLEDMFSPDEYDAMRPRITALTRLDLIGQEMVDAIGDIERAMASMTMPVM